MTDKERAYSFSQSRSATKEIVPMDVSGFGLYEILAEQEEAIIRTLFQNNFRTTDIERGDVSCQEIASVIYCATEEARMKANA